MRKGPRRRGASAGGGRLTTPSRVVDGRGVSARPCPRLSSLPARLNGVRRRPAGGELDGEAAAPALESGRGAGGGEAAVDLFYAEADYRTGEVWRHRGVEAAGGRPTRSRRRSAATSLRRSAPWNSSPTIARWAGAAAAAVRGNPASACRVSDPTGTELVGVGGRRA